MKVPYATKVRAWTRILLTLFVWVLLLVAFVLALGLTALGLLDVYNAGGFIP